MNYKILTLILVIGSVCVNGSIKGLVSNFGGFNGLSFLKHGTCDYTKCPPTPKHYDELRCSPIYNTGECCPKSFDCQHLSSVSISSRSGKCYFKGKIWSESSEIRDESLSRSCISDARCLPQGKFFYKHTTCSEVFGPPLQPGCIRIYAPNKCCSIGTVCGEDAERLPICEFEGKTYRAGERMYSSAQKCHQCHCTADWSADDVRVNKDCFAMSCNMELREVENIVNKCLPVYHSDVCCPFNWRCPHRNDAIVPAGNVQQQHDKAGSKCKFGNLEFNIGDRLSVREDACSNCTCVIPPMLSCTYSHTC